jgi:oxalate decarboxylase/phosphoglucose isomerase-like protein (cupin superfamily)
LTTPQTPKKRGSAYQQWMESIGIPIYEGHFVADLREVELEWWEDRKQMAAFLHLKGMDGVSEARVVEIAPGQTLPPLRMAIGELVYVLEGNGFTTVRDELTGQEKTFEWNERALFHIPRHSTHQIGNARGDKPARLLHYNYMPVAMSVVPDVDFFVNNAYSSSVEGEMETLFSEAVEMKNDDSLNSIRVFWNGNFFPDMGAWDKLAPYRGRGAGGTAVFMRFPNAEMGAHMSVFDPGLYKKGHRHGPGRVIVIPRGEGYSVLWKQGGEKIVCPWHESSVFVPPEDWYHQHFNTGTLDARYLALGPLPQFRGKGETLQDRADRQIEYVDEDPWIRQKFEEELAVHGGKLLMPDEAYTDPTFEWDYGDDD